MSVIMPMRRSATPLMAFAQARLVVWAMPFPRRNISKSADM